MNSYKKEMLMRDYSYGFEKFATRYENALNSDIRIVMEDKDFHMDNLRSAIKDADELLETISDDICNWEETLVELYEVDDADTLWKKLELSIMKWYANRKCERFLTEVSTVQDCKNRIEKCLNRIMIMSCF